MNETKKFLLVLFDSATENYLKAKTTVTEIIGFDKDGVPRLRYLFEDSPDKKQKFIEMENCLEDVVKYSEIDSLESIQRQMTESLNGK